MTLADGVRQGQQRAIARAISLVENDLPGREELIDRLYPSTGKAVVLGLTGPPGAGKSTLLDRLLREERKAGRKAAVIAVDPSSPFTGGALLGDRLRMQSHALDPGVYIRSMASRGHLGGIAGATADAVKIFDAAGYDRVIVETLGVGQTEIEIAQLSDLVLLVLVPGLGDEIQALKAGIMEIGDIYVINKSDKDESARLRAEVDYVLSLANPAPERPVPPVVMVSALFDRGIDDLIDSIAGRLQRYAETGEIDRRRRLRLRRELRQQLQSKINDHIERKVEIDRQMDQWVERLISHQETPYALINRQIEWIFKEMDRS